MVVKSQATRSRTQNRKIARRLLADKLEALEKGPESRAALKVAVKRKKKASKMKKANRKYRALGEEEKGAAAEDDEEEMEEVNAEEVGQGIERKDSSENRGM